MQNVIVCVKHSYDVQQIKYDPVTRKPLLADAPKKMGDIDRRAVEEALRIREKYGGKVIAVTVGDQDSVDTIKYAYAMGVDEGYVIIAKDTESLDTNVIALALARAIQKIGNYDLVICGSESVDGGSRQVPVKVATYLNLPFLDYAKSVRIESNNVIVTSNYEDGEYEYRAPMPAVIAVTLEINEPRIPTPMAILRASRKPVNTWPIDNLGIDLKSNVKVLDTFMPEMKRKRVIFDARDESKIPEVINKLIDALRQEGVIR